MSSSPWRKSGHRLLTCAVQSCLPLWPCVRVRDTFHQAAEELVEFRRGLGIPGLFQVVGGAVIAVGVPAPIDDFFGRSFLVAEDKSGGGNAALDEVEVIGPAHQ